MLFVAFSSVRPGSSVLMLSSIATLSVLPPAAAAAAGRARPAVSAPPSRTANDAAALVRRSCRRVIRSRERSFNCMIRPLPSMSFGTVRMLRHRHRTHDERPPAVDQDVLAGEVRRAVGCQKDAQPNDVLGL